MNITALEHEKLITPDESQGLRSRAIVLPPGAEVGQHSSHDHEEVVVIVKGDATIVINGSEQQVAARHAVYIPPSTVHNIVNNSPRPLTYVYVRTR